ncbi:MAG: gamma-glutamylcyclotransferase family protein [archaeon]|jgi:gamma-glutamylcyclotransferase (GGCT)/AIG2-like uncharacterized protein YtfP
MFKKLIILFCIGLLLGTIFLVLADYTRDKQVIVKEAIQDINKTYYFGYGSNMDINLLRQRIDNNSIVPVTYAKLEDYRLIFPREVGSVIPTTGHDVYGCLYLLSDEEIAKLDIVEGYREDRDRNLNSYNREWIDVFLPSGKKVSAEIYIQVNNLAINDKPGNSYKQTLVKGSRDCYLPEFYIDELEQIEVR